MAERHRAPVEGRRRGPSDLVASSVRSPQSARAILLENGQCHAVAGRSLARGRSARAGGQVAGARVIPLVLAVLAVAPQVITTASRTTPTSVTYGSVPPEVERVSIHEWQDAASPSRLGGDVVRQGSAVTIRATPDHRTLVRFERADGAYLIDGPFWWPLRDVERPLDRRWRRTLAAAAPDVGAGAMDFEWLSAGGDGPDQWPRCFQAGARLMSCWECPAGDPAYCSVVRATASGGSSCPARRRRACDRRDGDGSSSCPTAPAVRMACA